MTASSLLAVPPVDAGYELLGRLGDAGWSIVVEASQPGIRITARRGERVEVLECRSVAEGALELFDRLRWL